MTTSLVSILMAVYNGEKYLREAIESIVHQSYPHFELVVIDNGSTDGTADIALLEAENDQRIRYLHLTEKGKIKAYNEGFKVSKGDYICFVGADDLLPPESLQKRLSAAKKNVDGFSTCLLRTFSEESQYDGMIYPKIQTQPNYSGGSIFFSRPMANE
ncbi:MAG: glycosyltransferase family 2 protein, partial [Imperialibacter sp.]